MFLLLIPLCCNKRMNFGLTNENEEKSKLSIQNRILIEFTALESKLDMKQFSFVDLHYRLAESADHFRIPKKEIWNYYPEFKMNKIFANFIQHEYFFDDFKKSHYDFLKMNMLNFLYSGNTDQEKANYLFEILKNKNNCISYYSQKQVKILEILVCISAAVTGEILNQSYNFKSNQEDDEFQELLYLYSYNNRMPREFTLNAITTQFFPSSEGKQELNKVDFMKKMEECKYYVVTPVDLRKKFTNYVLQHKARAYMPIPSQGRPIALKEDQKFGRDRASFKGSQTSKHSILDNNKNTQQRVRVHQSFNELPSGNVFDAEEENKFKEFDSVSSNSTYKNLVNSIDQKQMSPRGTSRFHREQSDLEIEINKLSLDNQVQYQQSIEDQEVKQEEHPLKNNGTEPEVVFEPEGLTEGHPLEVEQL